jgi:hypothetical protein
MTGSPLLVHTWVCQKPRTPKNKELPMGKDTTGEAAGKELEKVIHIDESKIEDHLGQMVRKSVEATLNEMLDTTEDFV